MSDIKVYIAGKIGDLPVEIYTEKFNEAARSWRMNGHEVVSPIELPHNHERTWSAYMLENLKALSECNGIVMLDNWQESPGAKIEKAFAERMGHRVWYFADTEGW